MRKMRASFATNPEHDAITAASRTVARSPPASHLVPDERSFPVRQQLHQPARTFFARVAPDGGVRAAADQAEPAAGAGARARPRPARQPGGRRDLRRPAAARRRRPDRDGLCRPPVRPVRAAARRRPRHPARRGDRQRRRPPRHPAQGLGPDAVLPPRRRPCRARPGAARIHRQRGDGGAGHPHDPLACRGDHRRAACCAKPCCPAPC